LIPPFFPSLSPFFHLFYQPFFQGIRLDPPLHLASSAISEYQGLSQSCPPLLFFHLFSIASSESASRFIVWSLSPNTVLRRDMVPGFLCHCFPHFTLSNLVPLLTSFVPVLRNPLRPCKPFSSSCAKVIFLVSSPRVFRFSFSPPQSCFSFQPAYYPYVFFFLSRCLPAPFVRLRRLHAARFPPPFFPPQTRSTIFFQTFFFRERTCSLSCPLCSCFFAPSGENINLDGHPRAPPPPPTEFFCAFPC